MKTKDGLAWTEPFHGVQHFGAFSTTNYWATVCDYGTFAELSLWFPGCGLNPEKRDYDTAERARKAGARWVRQNRGNRS